MPSPLNDNLQDLARNLGDLVAPYVLREFYEEGTFTPTFQGSTGAGTFTYSLQQGAYRRMGDVCQFWGRVGISAISVAPTGDIRIAGLPFTVASLASPAAVKGGLRLEQVSNLDYPAGALEIGGYPEAGQTYIVLLYTRDNAATLAYPAASFTNTGTLISFSGSYLIAS